MTTENHTPATPQPAPVSVPGPTTVLGAGSCCTSVSEAPSAHQAPARPSTAERLRNIDRDRYLALVLGHPFATLMAALKCGDTAAWVESLEYAALEEGDVFDDSPEARDVVAAWDAAGHGPDLVRGLEALRTRVFGGGK